MNEEVLPQLHAPEVLPSFVSPTEVLPALTPTSTEAPRSARDIASLSAAIEHHASEVVAVLPRAGQKYSQKKSQIVWQYSPEWLAELWGVEPRESFRHVPLTYEAS